MSDSIYLGAFFAGLEADPLLTVSEWAEAYRILPKKASAEPGKWRNSRTPFLKGIMDALSPYHPARKIVFMKGAQIGGTECGNNWIGFVIHIASQSLLMVQPTVEVAKRVSKQRIAPMIEETAVLRELITPARKRDSGNTMFVKEYSGGVMIMTGANSAVGLRSMPIGNIFLDEIEG